MKITLFYLPVSLAPWSRLSIMPSSVLLCPRPYLPSDCQGRQPFRFLDLLSKTLSLTMLETPGPSCNQPSIPNATVNSTLIPFDVSSRVKIATIRLPSALFFFLSLIVTVLVQLNTNNYANRSMLASPRSGNYLNWLPLSWKKSHQQLPPLQEIYNNFLFQARRFTSELT